MVTLDDAVPCSICGERPNLIICTGKGRLQCPNYKSSDILHGNYSVATNTLTLGFTHWCDYFWSEEQGHTEGIPTVVKEWNYIHRNHITVSELRSENI